MVALSTVQSLNASAARSQPVVAVFAGASQGIGLTALKALADAHGTKTKGLRVYIIGRRKEAVDKIIADLATRCPTGSFRFLHSPDLSLLANVEKKCNEIIASETEICEKSGDTPRVDLLCMSQGDFSFGPYKENAEGIEPRYSLLYYSRMKFVQTLLPLLTATTTPSRASHVISVFAAGLESPTNLAMDDLACRQPGHQGLAQMRSHTAYMTNFFFEDIAKTHPGKISLLHVFPGLVMTDAFKNPGVPLWGRVLWRVVSPVLRLTTTSLEECGERVLFLADGRRFPAAGGSVGDGQGEKGKGPEVSVARGTDGKLGSGSYATDINGEEVKNEKKYVGVRDNGYGEIMLKHTRRAFEVIGNGEVLTE